MWLIVLTLFKVRTVVTIADISCTVLRDEIPYSNDSTKCKNVFSDKACLTVFPGTIVTTGESIERPLSCFTTVDPRGTDVIQDIKEAAIASCPKRCGYCCLTDDYNCKNSADPRVRCEDVTEEMCGNPHWYTVLSEDCPNTCGFCGSEKCKDEIDNCNSLMCITMGMEVFVKENCRRTCDFCEEKLFKSQCFDSHLNCEEWFRNGFCTNAHYSEAQKRRHCEKSCHLCFS